MNLYKFKVFIFAGFMTLMFCTGLVLAGSDSP